MDNLSAMDGKVCLITGATDGIGRVTAETLARLGAEVVIIGRSPEKVARTVAEIKQQTGNQKVDSILADLSVQADVRRAAEMFRQSHQRLHVLINNAGAIFMKRQASQDGIEMTFALNHLAYFLLTNLLLDLVTASAPARIINVSSGAHYSAKAKWDDLKDPRASSGWGAYGASKLANVAFTYELARRLEGTGVTANALHPGFVASQFGSNNGGIFKPIIKLTQMGAITPEKGAETTLYLATSPEVEGVTGKYFDRCKQTESSRASYDKEAAWRLWDLSQDLTGMR